MSQGSPDSNRHAISVALFGMLVLTLGMGIGRFLYTPMLPVLLSEGQFTFDQLVDCQRQLRRVSGGKPALLLWALSSPLTLTSDVANVRARYRRADSGDG